MSCTTIIILFIIVGCVLVLSKNPFRNFRTRLQLKPAVSETAASKQETTPRCNLFRSCPPMRKVVVTYLHNKIVGDWDDCESEACKVSCDKNKITHILNQILPPVHAEEIQKEAKKLVGLFGDKACLEERQFSCKVLMENSIWATAGETVVKEMVYLDNKYREITEKRGYLSSSCSEILEESLKEDCSSIVQLSKKDILLASELVRTLNESPHPAGDVVLSAELNKFIAHCATDYPFTDCYGSPTVLSYIYDRINDEKNYLLETTRMLMG